MIQGLFDVCNQVFSIFNTNRKPQQTIRNTLMRPLFGSRVHDFVFHSNSESTAGLVAFYVRESLIKYEPRITEIRVVAKPDAKRDNVMSVTVRYTIRSTNVDHNLVYPFYLRREQDLLSRVRTLTTATLTTSSRKRFA